MSGQVTGGRRLAWRLGLLTMVAVAVGTLLLGPYQFLLGTVAGSTGGDARPAPCLPGDPVAILDSPHISQADAGSADYNSIPPTSGPHFPFTISPGVYREPVPEGLTVHAMEHGHVIIQYAPDIPDRDLAELDRLARRYGADVVLAPYPRLTGGIAITAWGRIDRLDRYDEGRLTDFITALRGRYNHGWTVADDCP